MQLRTRQQAPGGSPLLGAAVGGVGEVLLQFHRETRGHVELLIADIGWSV